MISADSQESAILVINCGSSSVKFAVIAAESEELRLSGLVERVGTPETSMTVKRRKGKTSFPLSCYDLPQCLGAVLEQVPDDLRICGVGHRVVHGGETFSTSVVIDESVLEGILACAPLAPLHNPANLAGIEAARAVFDELPHVAVFDTAFHQTLPPKAFHYAVPYEWYEEQRVRRYGFHGTSHHFVAEDAAKRIGKPLDGIGVITAHLGNGCSACAVEKGKSVDTTMGLSPLEGLVMGTRSGDVDPALHGYLQDQLGWSLDRITKALNKESGLAGLSGISNDMRTLLESDEYRAVLAVSVFSYRLAKAIGALTAGLSRLDALVFTGGIGENAAAVRTQTVSHLGNLGFALDESANETHGRVSNGLISREGSRACYVIPTNEELMIARETLNLIER